MRKVSSFNPYYSIHSRTDLAMPEYNLVFQTLERSKNYSKLFLVCSPDSSRLIYQVSKRWWSLSCDAASLWYLFLSKFCFNLRPQHIGKRSNIITVWEWKTINEDIMYTHSNSSLLRAYFSFLSIWLYTALT